MKPFETAREEKKTLRAELQLQNMWRETDFFVNLGRSSFRTEVRFGKYRKIGLRTCDLSQKLGKNKFSSSFSIDVYNKKL